MPERGAGVVRWSELFDGVTATLTSLQLCAQKRPKGIMYPPKTPIGNNTTARTVFLPISCVRGINHKTTLVRENMLIRIMNITIQTPITMARRVRTSSVAAGSSTPIRMTEPTSQPNANMPICHSHTASHAVLRKLASVQKTAHGTPAATRMNSQNTIPPQNPQRWQPESVASHAQENTVFYPQMFTGAVERPS